MFAKETARIDASRNRPFDETIRTAFSHGYASLPRA
jgi:hypothetical protein